VQAALDRGVAARAYDVPSSGTAGAAFHGNGTPGTARIVVDERHGVLVGATFTGTEVADWLQAATIAIVSKTPGRVAVAGRSRIPHSQRNLAEAARAPRSRAAQ